jgi:hypothetical protein
LPKHQLQPTANLLCFPEPVTPKNVSSFECNLLP